MGAVESKTAVKSKAIQRGPERCCETKGYVEGLVESIRGLEPKVMLESKATSQLGAVVKRSCHDQERLSSAVARIKSNCQAQCHDHEQLSSAVVKIKRSCQEQSLRSRVIVKCSR